LDSANLYDLFSAHKDYGAASEQLHGLIRRLAPDAKTLLDVACGTGGHLQHLCGHFDAEGLDQSPRMLEIARRKCPNLVFHEGDMTRFDLGRRFDAVTCLFGSIGYTQDTQGLRSTIRTMSQHLNANGILMLEPWLTPSAYRPDEITADFIDERDLKACRMYVARLDEGLSRFDIDYLVADPSGIHRFTEAHALGLFEHQEYLDAFEHSGLEVVLDDGNLFGYGLIVGVRLD